MKAFLDLGALSGDTIISGRRWYPKFDRYYAFEPLAENYASLCRTVSTMDGVTTINAAVDKVDGEATFYHGTSPGRSGGSLCEKSNCSKVDKETVKTIRFSRFLADTFQENDYLVLKLDIEGKEYDVLEDLLESGTISYVNEIFCEWHFDRIKVDKARHERIIKELNRRGLGVTGYNRLDEFHYVVQDWESLGKMRYNFTTGWSKWKLRLRYRQPLVFKMLASVSHLVGRRPPAVAS